MSPIVRALGVSIGADPAVVRGVGRRRTSKPARSARQAARPEGRQAPLVRHLRQRIRLVHELESCDDPKNSFDRRDDRLGVDQVPRIAESMSWWTEHLP